MCDVMLFYMIHHKSICPTFISKRFFKTPWVDADWLLLRNSFCQVSFNAKNSFSVYSHKSEKSDKTEDFWSLISGSMWTYEDVYYNFIWRFRTVLNALKTDSVFRRHKYLGFVALASGILGYSLVHHYKDCSMFVF